MNILSTISEMRAACADLRRRTATQPAPGLVPPPVLGLVPTMGALHAGHLSLVRAARQHCKITTVSIFVNPTQFGPSEDLALYPRTFDEDCDVLEREGVDLLFAPEVAEIYPYGRLRTSVDVAEMGERLDGRSRPGHFRGVATVVAKLFGIVTPDVAFFGQKDAAQVAVLRAMVEDLNFATRIFVCPTVRESDDLALSSRNRYLSASELVEARALSAALKRVQEAAQGGITDAATLGAKLREHLANSPGVRVDYAEIVDPETLAPVHETGHGALVAVAAYVGTTRLIDNVVLPPTPGGAEP